MEDEILDRFEKIEKKVRVDNTLLNIIVVIIIISLLAMLIFILMKYMEMTLKLSILDARIRQLNDHLSTHSLEIAGRRGSNSATIRLCPVKWCRFAVG